MNFREPSARAARALGVRARNPEAYAQERKTPDDIKVEQCVRVVHAAVTARPLCLLPAMKAANHHLRRMEQVVIHMVNLTRSEPGGPMRFFQLASEASLAGSDRGARKEAVLEMAGEERPVLQILDRLSLGVQYGLYALDDLFAMCQKKPLQLDVCMKRHVTRRLRRQDAPRDRSAPIRERV